MRILFVTSDFPSLQNDSDGVFVKGLIRELRKYSDVRCVYFHLKATPCPLADDTVDIVVSPTAVFSAYSPEAASLENAGALRAKIEKELRAFCPDVIHCADEFAYLPFRFDKNVIYAPLKVPEPAALCGVQDIVSANRTKIAKTALLHSSLTLVYSDYARECARYLAGVECSPVVIPPAVDSALVTKTECRSLTVSCFCEQGDSIFALQVASCITELGERFCKRNNVCWNWYGSFPLASGVCESLFARHDTLLGAERKTVFCNSDIIILPNRAASASLLCLQALSSGALVLVPELCGDGGFAEPGRNCLLLPMGKDELIRTIRNAVLDFDKTSMLRFSAARLSREYTFRRSTLCHLYFYRLVLTKNRSKLRSAYSADFFDMLTAYNNASDVEKLHSAEEERIAFSYLYDSFSEAEKQSKILVLTGSFIPEEGLFSDCVTFVPVLASDPNGIVARPECLSYKDGSFDIVVAVGAWETVTSQCDALNELQRVCKKQLYVLYRTRHFYSWQPLLSSSELDWQLLSHHGWLYGTEVQKSAELAVALPEVPYGSAKYTRSGAKEIRTYSIATA